MRLLLLLLITLVPAIAEAEGTARYYCRDDDGTGYLLWMQPGGQLAVELDGGGEAYSGTYRVSGRSVSLSLPEIGFAEQGAAEVYKTLILTFETPSVGCKLTGHEVGPAVEGYAKCPPIRGDISGGGYEQNAFEFYADRGVKRRRWLEYTVTSSTRYAEFFGAYLIEGGQLYMIFGDMEDERILTAEIHADQSFSVNELQPTAGPCVPE